MPRIKFFSNAVVIDVGAGIDALAGVISQDRPYFADWVNFKSNLIDYAGMDIMDLKNPESMALTLKNLINNNNLRETIIKKGYERSGYFKKIDRLKILKTIIEDFKIKTLCWKDLNDN